MSSMFSSPDYPDPDPNIGNAAQENAQVARETLDWYKQVYADSKPRQAAMDSLTTQVVNDQLATSEQQRQIAKDQWDRYQSTFAPVEDQTVADAMNYDSAARKDRLAGEAATGVQAQYDNAQAQNRRSMAAMGINPNSGRAQALNSEGAISLAASKAGAANNARTATEDKAIALRTGVANFGRNMPNTAGQSLSGSVASGNSAVANQTAAGNAANASAALMGQGYSSAMQGLSNTANILQNQYNSQLNAWDQANQADATGSAGFGNLVGQLGSAWISKPISAAVASSKELKTNKRKIDINQVVKGLRHVPVEKWRYKDGVADGGEHIGPYAEDMQKQFGDTVAPGGRAIDIVSALGVNLAAVKALDKRLAKLEKEKR